MNISSNKLVSKLSTPADGPSERTRLMSEEEGTGGANGDGPLSSIAAAQKGVFEMGTVITQPGLKRADSTELLHLTLHQVMTSSQVMFCTLNFVAQLPMLPAVRNSTMLSSSSLKLYREILLRYQRT